MNQELMTLDFWQDTVIYEGKTFPVGTLACDALNVPADTITRMNEQCEKINLLLGMLNAGQDTSALFPMAKEAALTMLEILSKTPPFSYMDIPKHRERIEKVFTADNALKYVEFAIKAVTNSLPFEEVPKYADAVMLQRYTAVCGHLAYSLEEYQKAMLDFAEKSDGNEADRTAEGFAKMFGSYFPPKFSITEGNAWMSVANNSVQYVATIRPGEDIAKLVKRMHYVSFVGMFRSDFFEGLCVDVGALTAEQRSNFGTITQAAALFKGIGGVAFGFMLPVLAGYIGMAIGDRPALAVGFVGGMMAANGKSGFLGALVAGFAAGYIILGLKKLCVKLPETIEKLTPVLIYPVAGILIIGLLMQFIVEPVMGGINTGLNSALTGMSGTSKIALGFILGGMMAVDMGGPFNKAAYVFGTASIIAGNYDIMAAVMIGGMTPPCAIALATMLFPNKFTKQEREAGPTNFIMGLAFITEGAIPYAASDPLHVIPACVIGSGIAGAMSMAFKCTLMAPHGGIFVVPVIGNPWMYLIALVVGMAVSTVLLGVLKKKVR